jgi:glycosyltransferase involved in cell wall biosynthesis
LKDRRTLLLATYHFPPSAASGSFRLLGFAKHLLAHGWRTVVVAPPCMPFEPVDNDLARQVPTETKVYSVPMAHGNRLTRRLAPFGIWLPAALRACGRAICAERPHAVLTSSPPHTIHVLGRLVKSRFGLPWLVDYRDPWMYGQGKSRPRGWHAQWETLQERLVLRAADAVIVNTPLAAQALLKDLPELAPKTVAITNGFDPESFVRQRTAEDDRAEWTILHTGELYGTRDPRPLLDALTAMDVRPLTKRLRVAFLGQSSAASGNWPEEVRRRGLDNVVEFAGHVQYQEAIGRMQSADILLLLDNPGRRVGIPAKLFEYFGAGRPILALAEPDGDVGWALRTSGVRHRIAAPRDVGAIRRAVTELIDDMTKHASAEVPPIPYEFTRAHMAAELARLLNQKTARRRAPWVNWQRGDTSPCGDVCS